VVPHTGGGTFFKVGDTSARQKNIENFCGLNWQLWRSHFGCCDALILAGTALSSLCDLNNVTMNEKFS